MRVALFDALGDAALRAGVPFMRKWVRHVNDVGLPYTDPTTRSCELIEYKLLLASVFAQTDETVQRMVTARGESL